MRLRFQCSKSTDNTKIYVSTAARHRSSKYLNHLIEPDHRRVKQRLGTMLGLKSFGTAAVVIRGIELAEKIKKGQYKMGRLAGSKATTPEIWQAALAA
jgi:transposase-like protein